MSSIDLRRIPSMERILSSEAFAPLIDEFGRDAAKEQASLLLAELRRSGNPDDVSIGALAEGARQALSRRHAPSLRRVINGTGIIIHTNLGRSPIAQDVWADATDLVTGYSNLELDLESGKRGSRESHVTALARELFGVEAALLVNNNAAAVLLVLASLARGKEVLVSRSELVEIGGAFRVPDVIEQGGAKLREVGTTNRTRASDFEAAMSRKTAAILRVHQSNFQIVGFTEAPDDEALAVIARKKKIPFIIDEGSGRVVDISKYGFQRQPTIREHFAAGAGIVTCSTDKLIGSVQGGLILGSKELVSQCARHPLMRALRVGKETYSLLALNLRAFLAGKEESTIPVYRMLSMSVDSLRKRATAIAESVNGKVVVTDSALGGGTTPTESIPSIGVALDGSATGWQERLLRNDPPIMGRIVEDRFLLDLRTVREEEDAIVVAAAQT